MNEQFQEVIEQLEVLKEEADLNKRFKDKARIVINILNSEIR